MTHYDIVIIGGGMVGASLACALQRLRLPRPIRVAIVEVQDLPKTPEQGYQPSYDARSTALSYGTRLIYEELGLWHRLAQQVTPIRHIHVSDRGHFGATRLHAAEEGVEALGYVVANQWLGQVLLQPLRDSECVDFICPAQVTEIQPQEGGRVHLTVIREGQSLQLDTALAVVADGGRSAMKEHLGIASEQIPYEQSAVIANLTPTKSHRYVAYERFTERGAMALLPLGARDVALVWTLPGEQAEHIVGVPDSEFLAQLQDTFGYRLGRLLQVGQRFVYPLQLVRAKEQIRPGIVVLGNAAHTLHPVAGQGYNLALRGAATLAGSVREALERGESPGALNILEDYQARRQQDQQQVIGFSDRLIHLFSHDRRPLNWMRGLGLVSLDLCPPAKHWFARQAMGLGAWRT